MFKDCFIMKRGKKIDLTKRDCNAIKTALEPYGVFGPTPNRYCLEDSPTKSLYDKTITTIKERLRKYPDQTYLIVYCFAGHNMQKDGKHICIVNEFDETTNFYKICDVE